MEKKEWLKIGMYLGLAFLLIIVALTILHFTSNKDNIVIDLTPSETEDDTPFLNLTDYSEAFIRDLVSTKRDDLQKVFDNMVMYNLNNEDEETVDTAVSELFIDDLKPIVTDDLLEDIMTNLTPVNPSEIMDVDFNVYKIDTDWLDEIKNNSAIASNNVSEYHLHLKEADIDRIEATVTIVKCQKVCDIKEDYPIILILDEESNSWKIDKIN